MSDDGHVPSSEIDGLIGGKFKVQGDVESLLGYQVVSCEDADSGQLVELRLLPIAVLAKHGAVLRVQRAIKKAGGLAHKNVTRVVGYGKAQEDVFVVEENVKGLRLSHLLTRRKETQRPFELKEAFYLTIHLCNGLAYARDTMPHGFLAPSHILMRQDGRAKVGGFGMGDIADALADGCQMGDWDRACLDVVFEDPAQKDLYALGRIFHALLKNDVDVSRPFTEQVEEDEALSPGLIRLLLRCAGSPDVKPLKGPSDFREELHFIVSEMFDRMVPLSNDATTSAGPPPMPHEVLVESVAKPAGIDLDASRAANTTSESMAELRWMYRVGTSEFGPVSGGQLVDKLNRGDLSGYVEVRDIQKKRFRPLSDTPAFRKVFEEWMNQSDAREERLADERSQATSKKWRSMASRVALVLLIVVFCILGGRGVLAVLEPSPKAIDMESLVAYVPPEIQVPELIEHDPEFKKKLAEYKALMARQPKKRFRTKGGEAVFQSVIDFSKGAASQGQVEEEMTRRLYGSLSRHRGLLTCLQAALPEGVASRSFNVRVTVLPDGSLTEVSVPGGDMTVSVCVRKVLRSYRVRSIKGVTVSATLPFTVQR